MNVKQVTVRFGVTANLGNFNSTKVEVELVAEVDPLENYQAVYARLMEEIQDQVFNEVKAIKKGH